MGSCSRPHPKKRPQVKKLGLSEYVCNLINFLNILYVDDASMYQLPYKVHVDLNVIHLLMPNWIYANRYSAHIVTVDNGRPPKVNTKLCQDIL